MAIIYQPRGRALEYGPLAANLYDGCTHGCLYCYAPSCRQKRREDYHALAKPRKDIIKLLEKDARDYQGQEVFLCFTCDPWPADTEIQLAGQAIDVLTGAGVRARTLTKAGRRSMADIPALVRNGGAYGATMTFMDQAKSAHWEPMADTPTGRIEALAAAHSAGIETWVSLEPVIEPAESLRIIEATHEIVDVYKVGTLNYNRAVAGGIDWPKFAREVRDMLQKFGKNYYLKADLRKYLPENINNNF